MLRNKYQISNIKYQNDKPPSQSRHKTLATRQSIMAGLAGPPSSLAEKFNPASHRVLISTDCSARGERSRRIDFCILIFAFCLVFGFCILCSAQQEFTYDAKGKRNPFIPLVTPDGRLLKLEKEETASELLLEGIIYDEHGLSYAIVNGAVVRVSDKVGDSQVLKIEKNKVIFIKSGQTLEVELKEEGL